MSFLRQITPQNLLEEKSKFMADYSYNPQFTYQEEITQEKLYQHGFPQKWYSQHAQNILDAAYHHRNERDLTMMKGPVIDQEEVNHKILSFLKMHHLDGRFEIIWSSSFLSRVTITSEAIKLKTIAEYRKDETIGMLYHEIGTHALRRINYEQQPWYKKKKKFEFGDYLRTEEGLASLHSLLPLAYKSAYSTALRYLAVQVSQEKSFSELWQYLTRYVDDLETRWMICVRQKRGITDTSQPGGFTKDLVYFEGLVQVCQWLIKNNFDLESLYWGKMAWQDVAKAKQMNPNFKPALPSFYTLDKDKYRSLVSEIGDINELVTK